MANSGTKNALLSVSNKIGLVEFAGALQQCGYTIYASGGTAAHLRDAGMQVLDVSALTKHSEMLDGRVKTLHPAIHAGILARANKTTDFAQLLEFGYEPISLVCCVLYDFEAALQVAKAKKASAAEQGEGNAAVACELIEEIDIGGVTLLRAAAKNFERVTVVCDPADYDRVAQSLANERDGLEDDRAALRAQLARKAFRLTALYDTSIAENFNELHGAIGNEQLQLRYGMNPHQRFASLRMEASLHELSPTLPVTVLCGTPSAINVLDALHGWQLVRELDSALASPAAASFKHVSPSGAAVFCPLSGHDAQVCAVADCVQSLSQLAVAYARARGCDRLCSFGDFVSLSRECDASVAHLLAREVSDGVIAPAYSADALAILSRKKGGRFVVLKIDPLFRPCDCNEHQATLERRTVFGLTLTQSRNEANLTRSVLRNVATAPRNAVLSDDAQRDLLVAAVTTKYTQSNSVVYARDGQTVGVGAGQQSRIHCTRLAGDKADNWWLRHHPKVIGLKFAQTTKRTDVANLVDLFVTGQLHNSLTDEQLSTAFEQIPAALTPEERTAWLAQLDKVALCSDGFFPFTDSIDRAKSSGVKYLLAPNGSMNDEAVVKRCDKFDMTLLWNEFRLFHH